MFRVLLKSGAILEDITEQVHRLDGKAISISVNNGDCLYIGSRLKFNSAYLSVNVKPLASCIGAPLIYNGSQFEAVGDHQDWTNGLTESGMITFEPAKNKGGWQFKDTDEISELNTFEIRNLAWAKIPFTSTEELEIEYIGHRFSDDVDLFGEYPMLAGQEFLAYFGGTDYEKQHIIAGELIEKGLITLAGINGIEQVLTASDLRLVSVSKVAEIIFSNCGDNFAEKVAVIKAEYDSRLNKAMPIIDNNNNAIIDGNSRVSNGRFYR